MQQQVTAIKSAASSGIITITQVRTNGAQDIRERGKAVSSASVLNLITPHIPTLIHTLLTSPQAPAPR